MNRNMVVIGTYQKSSSKVIVSYNEKLCFFNNIYVDLIINKFIDLKIVDLLFLISIHKKDKDS